MPHADVPSLGRYSRVLAVPQCSELSDTPGRSSAESRTCHRPSIAADRSEGSVCRGSVSPLGWQQLVLWNILRFVEPGRAGEQVLSWLRLCAFPDCGWRKQGVTLFGPRVAQEECNKWNGC